MALKLLVVGDVAGHIDTLMAKAASVHRSKNGPFDVSFFFWAVWAVFLVQPD